ncbi:glycosyltransferase [Candidatus Microgenomates bacterium]|nr:glycosyltransferase [Candidatus Microgenomates bacterium]
MSKIVVIMPTYNERENISRMVDVLLKEEFPKIIAHEMHLLVVDGNSPDGSGELVKGVEKKYPNLHLLTEKQKRGLGWAYIDGMKYAINKLKADAVIEMDADFQHNPADIKRLIAAMDAGADVVIGARYIKGGSVPKEWALYRKLLSWGGNLFARSVLLQRRLHDLTTGFRLTKTKFLKQVDLDNLLGKKAFAYKMHLTMELQRLGAKIVEIPIAFLPRKKEKSKLRFKETIDSLFLVLVLRVKYSIRFFKFAVVGGIGFIINAVMLEVFRSMDWTVMISNYFLFNNFPIGVFHQPAAWAAAASAEIAIFSNYNLDNYWTFRDVRVKARKNPFNYLLKFLQFNLTSIGAVIIQFLVIGLGVIVFGDTRLTRIAFLVIAVVALIIPYNYTIYNLFIWKRWSDVPWLKWIQGGTN